ncbi:hypothetical protein GPL15_14635 [Clostridium sp. MCC353]|uniref:hypothetical protein n=1 Tax=Clostridium sp. MCC353 TaxID=2592646 RepID=UPI001C020E7E|nr:hypothetical protein [Clostridium sp. MCC353]MBT9777738.1 hypothetical protein [Clostridium sp. MCC353]
MTGKGEDGYVLGYFMILLMVIMIFITSVMSLSYGYYSRITKEKYRKQAFYTARSVAQAVAEEWVNNGETTAELMMEGFPDYGDIEISGLPKEMGTCILRTEYEEDTNRIYIWITADVMDQKGTAAAVLRYKMGSGADDAFADEGGWELAGYINGETKNDEILEEY